jgi:peptide/nickel transport system permease protein
MLIYILRRILYTLPIAMGVSLVCFALVHMAPGDPLSAITPEGASPQVVEQIRHAYGFDQSLPVQYYKWLEHVATGDFGTSIMTRRTVVSEVPCSSASRSDVSSASSQVTRPARSRIAP